MVTSYTGEDSVKKATFLVQWYHAVKVSSILVCLRQMTRFTQDDCDVGIHNPIVVRQEFCALAPTLRLEGAHS